MNPQDTSPADDNIAQRLDATSFEKTPFDDALRSHFQSDREPDDNGFSQRVLAALPAQTGHRSARWPHWALHAHWAAISLAGCGVAALASTTDSRFDGAQGLATYALIGLLTFWAIPSRWSRG